MTVTTTTLGAATEYTLTWVSAEKLAKSEAKQRANDLLRRAYFDLYCDIRQGTPFAQALREYSCAIEDALDLVEGVPA